MSAYNKVNGQYCAENAYLLHDVLKKQWGFKGFVISDWGSTYSTAATVNAGMDLEMPGGEPMKAWFARPADAGRWQRRRLADAGQGPAGDCGRADPRRRGGRQREPHAARDVRRRPVR